MKNCKKKCESMRALKLALIITGSIVAAVGIVILILKLCKKKCHANQVCDCCCDESESNDSWDIDEDALGELELDDDDCCCDECGADDAEEDGEASAPEAEEKSDDAE